MALKKADDPSREFLLRPCKRCCGNHCEASGSHWYCLWWGSDKNLRIGVFVSSRCQLWSCRSWLLKMESLPFSLHKHVLSITPKMFIFWEVINSENVGFGNSYFHHPFKVTDGLTSTGNQLNVNEVIELVVWKISGGKDKWSYHDGFPGDHQGS